MFPVFNARPRKINYKPPDPAILEEAKERRIKEMKMYSIIREIVFYAVFLWILTMVSYDFRDPWAATMKFHLSHQYDDQGLPGFTNSFSKVSFIVLAYCCDTYLVSAYFNSILIEVKK